MDREECPALVDVQEAAPTDCIPGATMTELGLSDPQLADTHTEDGDPSLSETEKLGGAVANTGRCGIGRRNHA